MKTLLTTAVLLFTVAAEPVATASPTSLKPWPSITPTVNFLCSDDEIKQEVAQARESIDAEDWTMSLALKSEGEDMGVCYDTTLLPKYALFKAWFFTMSGRCYVEESDYQNALHLLVLSTRALLILSEYDMPPDVKAESDQLSQMNDILANRVRQETGIR